MVTDFCWCSRLTRWQGWGSLTCCQTFVWQTGPDELKKHHISWLEPHGTVGLGPWLLDRGSWTMDHGLGPWVLDCGSWTVALRLWVLDHGSRTVGLGPWVLDHGSQTVGLGPWLSDCGSWTMGLGLWVSDCGSWRLGPWGLGPCAALQVTVFVSRTFCLFLLPLSEVSTVITWIILLL